MNLQNLSAGLRPKTKSREITCLEWDKLSHFKNNVDVGAMLEVAEAKMRSIKSDKDICSLVFTSWKKSKLHLQKPAKNVE